MQRMPVGDNLPVLKLLIVDDSPLIVARLIENLGALRQIEICGTAKNMPMAISMLDTLNPDVVILDIHLGDDGPFNSGIDLLISMKKQLPEITVIMLTNLSEAQYREKCLELGAGYFLDKSNEFEKIPEVLNLILETNNKTI